MKTFYQWNKLELIIVVLSFQNVTKQDGLGLNKFLLIQIIL